MKKICVFLFALVLSIGVICFSPKVASAQNDTLVLGKNAKSCVLADAESGEIVYQKNSTDKLPIASMTKIMTLLVIYDNIINGKISLDDDVVVSSVAAGMGGSQAFLDADSTHKAVDLIKTIIIASANDSCVALAEHVSGSKETFVNEMNKKGKELGLVATNFVNCTGLPALNQYSCAVDCVKMFSALIKQNNNYFDYSKIWMDDYKHPGGRITQLTNTNRLVRFFNGCDGGKTGYTDEARHCLCATAKKGDTRLIACVLGEPDSKTRFAEVSQMLNFGFANYSNTILLSKDNAIQVDVKGGKTKSISVKSQENLSVFLPKNESADGYEVVTQIERNKAPINQGEVVGTAFLIKNNNVIAKTALYSTDTVSKKSYFDTLHEIGENW